MIKRLAISAWLSFATLPMAQSVISAEMPNSAPPGFTTVAPEPNEMVVDHPGVYVLSFLVGRWQSESPNRIVEQTWSSPLGSGMVGVLREIKENKTVKYEFQTFEDTRFAPVMTRRRFTKGPNDVGESSVLVLDSYTKKNALFKGEHSTINFIKVSDDLVNVETQEVTPEGTRGAVSKIELRRLPK